MDNRKLTGPGLETHCEMAVLRMLVESMLTAMSFEEQDDALARYGRACEQQSADLLAVAVSEAVLTGMARAIRKQRVRLESAGLPVADLPGVEDSQGPPP